MTDETLIRLVRKVLRLDARKHQRRDVWTLRYTYEHRGGRTGEVSHTNLSTVELRDKLLATALGQANSAAAEPARIDKRLEEMRARHRLEADRAEADRERAIVEDDKAKRALAEVVEALRACPEVTS